MFYSPVFYSKLQQLLYPKVKLYPLVLTWYVTLRCNLSCVFCFQQKNYFSADSGQELSTKEAFKFIDDLVCLYRFYPVKPLIIISGGEPLLRDDIFSLCDYIEEKGLRYRFASSMSLDNSFKITQLARLKPQAFGISIDPDAETYAANRNKKKLFNLVVKNIDRYRLLNKTVPIKLCCIITDKNIGTLYKLPALAKRWGASLNVCHLQFLTPVEKNRYYKAAVKVFGSKINPVSGSVNFFEPPAIKKIAKAIAKTKRMAKKYKVYLKVIPEIRPKEVKRYYSQVKENFSFGFRCRSHYHELRIASNGKVYPCLQYSYGNVKEACLKDIFSGQAAIRFRKIMEKNDILPGCFRCSKKILYKKG
jgi:MoaA/NifB/PqqE/SkfB family radical SAM enzyme